MPPKEGSTTEALMQSVASRAGEEGLSKLLTMFGGSEIEIGGTQSDASPLAKALGFEIAERVKDDLRLYDADNKLVRQRYYVPSRKAVLLRATVKALLLEGLSSKEVARRAGVSTRTVFVHAKRLRREGCNVQLLPDRSATTGGQRLFIGKLELAVIRGESLERIVKTCRKPEAFVLERAALLASRGVITANPYQAAGPQQAEHSANHGGMVGGSSDAADRGSA